MSPLLRLARWHADKLLQTWFPIQQEPSLADLEAEALADKEAGEEADKVSETNEKVNKKISFETEKTK